MNSKEIAERFLTVWNTGKDHLLDDLANPDLIAAFIRATDKLIGKGEAPPRGPWSSFSSVSTIRALRPAATDPAG